MDLTLYPVTERALKVATFGAQWIHTSPEALAHGYSLARITDPYAIDAADPYQCPLALVSGRSYISAVNEIFAPDGGALSNEQYRQLTVWSCERGFGIHYREESGYPTRWSELTNAWRHVVQTKPYLFDPSN